MGAPLNKVYVVVYTGGHKERIKPARLQQALKMQEWFEQSDALCDAALRADWQQLLKEWEISSWR